MAKSNALVPLEGFTFGCDPELVILDADQQVMCATGIIPGSKEEPFPVSCGAVQPDGFAAEFNIDPCSTFDEFDYKIETVIGELKKFLPKGATLHSLPSIHIPEPVFDAAPDKAKMLGCSPDMNAWTGEVNPPPECVEDPLLRTFSGHLHFGWDKDIPITNPQHIMNCRDLVKQLDWLLGPWSLTKDTDPNRRKLYGKAGACRYKDYGVEYRVLSNFWVQDPKLRLEVWNRSVKAIEMMERSYLPKAYVFSSFNTELIQSINTYTLSKSFQEKFKFPTYTLRTF